MSRRIIIALLTMFFFAGFMAPVSAAPEASDLAAAAVAQAQQKGYATAAQRAIILSEPEVARTTADPAATQVQVESVAPQVQGESVNVSGCKNIHGWVTAINWYGATLWKYHQYVSFCYNGSTVTSMYGKYTSVTILCCGYYSLGNLTFTPPKSGVWKVDYYTVGHFRQCVGPICGDDKGHIHIYLYGSGSYTVSGYVEW